MAAKKSAKKAAKKMTESQIAKIVNPAKKRGRPASVHKADDGGLKSNRKPGRPKGSVSKKTARRVKALVKKHGVFGAYEIINGKKKTGAKRGRPKGSTNKKTVKKTGAKRGRPKGSRNKTTMTHGGKTITITLHGK